MRKEEVHQLLEGQEEARVVEGEEWEGIVPEQVLVGIASVHPVVRKDLTR